MPGAGEPRLLKTRAQSVSYFHISQLHRTYDCEIGQGDDFIADLLEAKQLDADTRMAIDALEAAQANTMSWVNMLVDC